MATIITRAGKGSALTWTEGDANITNLNNDKIENVVEDLTPQLGGDLDVNAKKIVSTSNGDIVLEPNGTGKVTTPAIFNASILASTQSSGDEGGQIELALAATNSVLTGSVAIDVNQSQLRIFETGGSNRGVYINLANAATGVGTDLLAGGGSGISDIVQDTTPQLGGNLDVNGNSIVSVSNGNINIEPNGSGLVYLAANQIRIGDQNSLATLTTWGTGSLVLSTAQGSNTGIISITHGLNNNISITPQGTGQTVVKNLEYNEFVFDLGTTSGTIAPNVANGNVQTITLNGNLTINAFTSPVSGQSLTLIINTGGTGRTLTSTMLFAGGSKTLSTTNTTDILVISYIGTTYYASLIKDYK